MLKVSQIISKEVISVYECESLGTIKNVLFNEHFTKVTKFVFFHDETEHESFVKLGNVFAMSQDGLLVKNATKADFYTEQDNTPIHKRIMDFAANDYGKICDVEFDEKGNVTSIITTSGKCFLPQDIATWGNICFVKQSEQKVSIASFKPKINLQKTDLTNQIEVKIVAMQEPTQNTTPLLPPRITSNFNALVGRKVSKTIFGRNNEVIIRQFGLITHHTLELAKAHNRTNELLLNIL